MHRISTKLIRAAGLTAAIAVSSAWGQSQPATRLIGTIERADASSLVVKTAQAERQVTVPANVPVFGLEKATLADVKPGVFVGVGATPQPDGSQRAIRVIIFTEAMRGLGEGHRPWDRPGTTMTNATVETSVSQVAGQVLTVKYKGGEKNIVIGPEAAIMTYVAGDKSELKPGARVVVTGAAGGNGAFEASRIVVGRGGITPN